MAEFYCTWYLVIRAISRILPHFSFPIAVVRNFKLRLLVMSTVIFTVMLPLDINAQKNFVYEVNNTELCNRSQDIESMAKAVHKKYIKDPRYKNRVIQSFCLRDLDGFKSQVDYHVKIPCFSSTTIENCLWYRNGIPTSISGRYLYVGDGDGHNTNDCSIQILNWFTLDVGKWTCAGKDGDEVLSITLPYLIKMSGDTQNVFAVRGNWVLLICRFNEAVSCAWQRRGLHTAISGRYENARLGNSEGNDCSIIIKDFDQIDEGLWQCEGTKPGSMTPSQLSWTLTFYGSNNIIQQPSDISTFEGATETLHCRFQFPVDICIWLHNSTCVEMSGGYGFRGEDKGRKTSDCSLIFTSMKRDDTGVWRCTHEINSSSESVISKPGIVFVISNSTQQPEASTTAVVTEPTLNNCESDTSDDNTTVGLVVFVIVLVSCHLTFTIVTFITGRHARITNRRQTERGNDHELHPLEGGRA